uniref:Cyclic nucleotide-binding domain-containing protein n=1 Tax=Romanomermis culicivorax TaxID=13658 RepID=A0A915KXY8_ROMCU
MLRLDMETATRPTKRPPAAFFEADTSISDSDLPPELVYMLKNIRVFGHFEAPLFLELCKHMEVIKVPVGHTLFKPGDSDDSIYVVQQGQLTVYIKEHDEEFPVKIVPKGDSVYSLLSILDVLTGSTAPFKTCSARADVDSIVLKLCAQVFNDIFEKYQESWLRVIQIIVLTLQRVTLATLHVYLGLSQELTKMVIKEIPTRKLESRHDTIAKARAAFATNRSSSCAVEAFTATLQRLPNLYSKPVGHLDLSEIKDLTSPIEHVSTAEESEVKESGGDSTLKYMAKRPPHLKFCESDESVLIGRLTIETFQPGHILCEQGSLNVPLIYVLNGSLELTRNTVNESEMLLSIVHCQEMAGCLAVLTGEPSFYSCKTRQFSRLAIIKKDHFYE